MPTFRRRLARILLVGTSLCLALVLITFFYYRSPGPLNQPTTLIFEKGTGFTEIVSQMADAGVIRFPLLFKAVAVLQGDARKFKAGEYKFTAAISPKLVMDMVAEGRVVVHKITIPEGLRSAEILAFLDKQELLEGEVRQQIAEGSLLPQTYHFNRGDSRQSIIVRMQEAMQKMREEVWPKRQKDLPIKTIDEAVVLASIVEKETGLDAERPRVAAVFINRLNIGMMLQSDPTVIYAVEKDKGPLNRPLYRKDLKYDSPYNTYKYGGIPPGPIANPGRAALEAVLNPPKTKELYFVATGTGGHNFSTNLKQHNEYVRQYRAVMKGTD